MVETTSLGPGGIVATYTGQGWILCTSPSPGGGGVYSQSLACPDLHFLQAHVWVLPGVLQRYDSFTLSCPIPQVGKLVAS